MTEKHIPAPQEIDTRIDTGELEAIYALDYEETPVNHSEKYASPTGERVIAAAERIAAFLDRHAAKRTLKGELSELRARDHSDYVDRIADMAAGSAEQDYPVDTQTLGQKLLAKEHVRSDREQSREQMIENGKEHLRGLGYIALAAGALGAEKVSAASKATGETALGFGIQGYKAAEKRVSHRLKSLQFRRELNQDARTARLQSREELKQFDRKAKQQKKETYKDIAQDIRSIKKERRQFDKAERADLRREKIQKSFNIINVAYEGKKEAVKVRVESGKRRVERYAGLTKASYDILKDAAVEKKRKAVDSAARARSIGAAALAEREARK